MGDFLLFGESDALICVFISYTKIFRFALPFKGLVTSNMKLTLFEKLINKLVEGKPYTYKIIIA